MIEKFKKYLVIGRYETYSTSTNPNVNNSYKSGWIAEELWAIDEDSAKREWIRKVIRLGAYIRDNIEFEVREI